MALSRSDSGKLGYAVSPVLAMAKEKSRLTRERYEEHPSKCRTCEKTLNYADKRKEFCNRSCAATYTNQRYPKRKKEGFCETCNEPVARRRKYCQRCLPAGRAAHAASRLANDFVKIKTDPTRKRLLIRIRGHQCETCGRKTWCGEKIPLELDHIDGNSDNNIAENLRLLCYNCHALTPTHRGRNRGRGGSRQRRKNRRYALGLSC